MVFSTSPSSQSRDRQTASGLRRLGVRSGPRGYILPIATLTILYLVLELGFNARLLDVTGSHATKDEVTAIEEWGRVISGLAVTLFVWGTFIMPRAWAGNWTFKELARWMVLSGFVLMGGTYLGEKHLVDAIVNQSTPPTRKSAAQLQVVSTAITDGEASIAGLDLSASVLCTPEGKSFLALFPFAAISTTDLRRTLEDALGQVMEAEVARKIGSPEHFFNTEFRRSVVAVQKAFNDYVDRQPSKSDRTIDEDPDLLWKRYTDRLQHEAHLTPDQVPNYGWRKVADDVRGMGIPVPLDWNPQDHQAFVAAVRTAQEQVKEAYAAKATVPLGLGWDAFTKEPSVQKQWWTALAGSKPTHSEDTVLRPTMNIAEFAKSVYKPLLQDLVEKQIAPLESPDTDYSDGGSEQDLGRTAMQWVLVPPIALMFSLAGALTHIFKAFRYTLALRRSSLLQDGLLAGGVIIVASLAFAAPNEVTKSDVFRFFERQTRTTNGLLAALGVRWIVQVQPYAYPINETVRLDLLQGATFGYRPSQQVVQSCKVAAR